MPTIRHFLGGIIYGSSLAAPCCTTMGTTLYPAPGYRHSISVRSPHEQTTIKRTTLSPSLITSTVG